MASLVGCVRFLAPPGVRFPGRLLLRGGGGRSRLHRRARRLGVGLPQWQVRPATAVPTGTAWRTAKNLRRDVGFTGAKQPEAGTQRYPPLAISGFGFPCLLSLRRRVVISGNKC